MPATEPIPDLLNAVNEASGKFALWITSLTVGTYLAVSIGTTTPPATAAGRSGQAAVAGRR
jgi:hypothetical protein